MKEKLLFLFLTIILVLIIIFAVFIMNNVNNKEKIDEKYIETENTEIIVIEANNENFEKEVLNEERIVLVDFYATWCKPCKMLSPILEEVAKENSDIKLVKVNVDKNEELCSKYNIQAMPTIIVFKQGKIINSSVGLVSKEDIKALFENK